MRSSLVSRYHAEPTAGPQQKYLHVEPIVTETLVRTNYTRNTGGTEFNLAIGILARKLETQSAQL